MKKLIFMLLIAFTTINSNASKISDIMDSTTATAKSVVNSTVNGAVDAKNFVDTSGNFRLMYNDLKSGVLALATAFKTGAEQVLYIIGKKYFLMGIYAWIAVLAGFMLFCYSLYKFPNLKSEDEQDIQYFWFSIIGVVISVTLVALNIGDAINYTFNPEYYVLQEVIDMVKTLKQ